MLLAVILAGGTTWAVASDPEQAEVWLASGKILRPRPSSRMPAKLPSGLIESAPRFIPISPALPRKLSSLRRRANRAGGGTRPGREELPASSKKLATGSVGTSYEETPAPAEPVQDKSPKRAHAIAAGLSPDLPKRSPDAIERGRSQERRLCRQNGYSPKRRTMPPLPGRRSRRNSRPSSRSASLRARRRDAADTSSRSRRTAGRRHRQRWRNAETLSFKLPVTRSIPGSTPTCLRHNDGRRLI